LNDDPEFEGSIEDAHLIIELDELITLEELDNICKKKEMTYEVIRSHKILDDFEQMKQILNSGVYNYYAKDKNDKLIDSGTITISYDLYGISQKNILNDCEINIRYYLDVDSLTGELQKIRSFRETKYKNGDVFVKEGVIIDVKNIDGCIEIFEKILGNSLLIDYDSKQSNNLIITKKDGNIIKKEIYVKENLKYTSEINPLVLTFF
jgi:hypothetical protein